MTTHPEGELHRYIHSVLENGDQGPCRSLPCDKDALNDAIDKHAPRIGTISHLRRSYSLHIMPCAFPQPISSRPR
jgi:hypothetical protein